MWEYDLITESVSVLFKRLPEASRKFKKTVNEKMTEGWEPSGGVQFCMTPYTKEAFLMQAIKREVRTHAAKTG